MSKTTATEQLLVELRAKLDKSDAAQRKQWATFIVEQGISLRSLTVLLYADKTTATRFSWLLTDIILVDTKPVLAILSYLFSIRKEVSFIEFEYSFAKYWNLAGIPKKNMSTAVDLLLSWLTNTRMSILTRRHSLLALVQIVEKYPAFKNELQIILEDILQKEKPSNSLKNLAIKAFNKLKD